MISNWKLPAIRESTVAAPPDLQARRDAARSLPAGTVAPGVAVREAARGGVPCVVCEPAAAVHTAVYFHGGGYRLGSAERSTPFATRLAEAMRATVVVADYRLAPEHPFPAALHDAAAVYGQLLEGGQRDIVLVGDSAGGGLAAALAVAASSAGLPAPRALVLMSPWLDLTCTASTFASRADSDQLFSHQAAEQAAGMYLQGHDPEDPLASPILATLEGWPPALLFASTEEVLLDDSLTFTSKLALAGSPVIAQVENGVPHAWPAVLSDQPSSAAALDLIGAFLDQLDRHHA